MAKKTKSQSIAKSLVMGLLLSVLTGLWCHTANAEFFTPGKYWIVKWGSPNYAHTSVMESALFKVSLAGDTVVNGRPCVTLRQENLDGKWNGTADPFICYEEGSRIYYYHPWKEDFVCLLDFNLGVGESVECPAPYVATCREKQQIRGVERLVVTFDPVDNFDDPEMDLGRTYWIEGVGTHCIVYRDNVFVGPSCFYQYQIKECYEDGVCIYSEEDMAAFESKVDAIGADGVVDADATIYDLHGRRVANPQAGSIYIRGGKKVIW